MHCVKRLRKPDVATRLNYEKGGGTRKEREAEVREKKMKVKKRE